MGDGLARYGARRLMMNKADPAREKLLDQREVQTLHEMKKLRYGTIRRAALRHATLRYATLRYTTLRYAALRYTTLRYAALR